MKTIEELREEMKTAPQHKHMIIAMQIVNLQKLNAAKSKADEAELFSKARLAKKHVSEPVETVSVETVAVESIEPVADESIEPVADEVCEPCELVKASRKKKRGA